MTEELSISLAESINAAHLQCQASDQPIKDAILAKCNRVRECGILLMEAKEQLGHGNFGKWVREKLSFSEVSARLYMRFATANRNPITDLQEGICHVRDAMIASGALAAPLGHNSQNRSMLTWLDHFTSFAMKLNGIINGQIEKAGAPIEEWPEEQREATKKQLQPFVDLYNRLTIA